jgi:flagellar biosynthetic protein FliP
MILMLLVGSLVYGAPVVIDWGVLDQPDGVASSLKIVAALTVLSMAPALLLMTTSFARILIVLSFLRQSLGLPTLPPNPVLIGLALFLTFFTMAPTGERMYQQGWLPYKEGLLSPELALHEGIKPLKQFMIQETREDDLKTFYHLAQKDPPEDPQEITLPILLPSFLISELKTAFHMGFLVFVPFLAIDMVVAAILMAMGMMMLPPTILSLPLKVVLFVLVDGWGLICSSLVRSFGKNL